MVLTLVSFLFVIIIQRVVMKGATTGGKEDGVSEIRRATLGHMISGGAEFTGLFDGGINAFICNQSRGAAETSDITNLTQNTCCNNG